MKRYEKEALVKTFSLFFIVLSVFTTIIAYLYYKEQKHILNTNILLEMREYNYNFKSKKFIVDIVDIKKDKKYFILYFNDKNSVYSLFPISSIKNKSLKIIYPIKKYNEKIELIKDKIFLLFILSIIFLLVFSFVSSLYTLYPMKKALEILDEFFKDIVHDLNTPITSILLNSKFISKTNPSQEIEKIELSARRISDLYKNFEFIAHGFVDKHKDNIDLTSLINQRVNYFKQIYPNINFVLEVIKIEKNLDKNSFMRIIDNIISNSCKYNKPKGNIFIKLNSNELIIEDTGIGMHNPQKIFERYYKETNRGIGIGMNIVKKLCIENNFKIIIDSKLGIGTKIILKF